MRTGYSLAVAGLCAIVSGVATARAQNTALPDPPRPVTIETQRSVETSKTVAPDGSRIDAVHSVDRSQRISDENGQLSAKTHIEESGGMHAVTPPTPLTPPPVGRTSP